MNGYPPIGVRIRADREAAGHTLVELGREVGCGGPHISKVERGHENPSDDLLERLANELGADPDEYLLIAGRVPEWIRERLSKNPSGTLRQLRSGKSLKV